MNTNTIIQTDICKYDYKYKYYHTNLKLDGVAPLITDPPPTSFTFLSKNKLKIK